MIFVQHKLGLPLANLCLVVLIVTSMFVRPVFASDKEQVEGTSVKNISESDQATSGDQTNEDYQAIFTMGMIALDKGLYAEASELFIYIFNRTKSTRSLLELARVYYLTGDYQRSRDLFEDIKANAALPYGVKQSIDAYIDDLKTKTPNVDFGISVVSDSNPGNVTHHETVEILGNTFTVERREKDKQILGVRAFLTANWPLSKEGETSLYAQGEIRDYPNIHHDQQNAKVGVSHYLQHGQLGVKVAADIAKNFVHDNNNSVTQALNVDVYPFGNVLTRVSGRLAVEDYVKNDTFDADIRGLTFSQQYLAKGEYWLSGELGVNQVDRVDAYNSNRSRVMGLGMATDFGQVNTRYLFTRTRVNYNDVDPFFYAKRKDNKHTHRLDFQYRGSLYKDISPTVSLVHENNRSNIAFFEYSKVYLELDFDY